jgi:hypothetical protein
MRFLSFFPLIVFAAASLRGLAPEPSTDPETIPENRPSDEADDSLTAPENWSDLSNEAEAVDDLEPTESVPEDEASTPLQEEEEEEAVADVDEEQGRNEEIETSESLEDTPIDDSLA